MQYLALLLLPLLLLGGLINLIWMGGEQLVQWLKTSRERRIARIEAELTATELQLRSTILQLAEQLGGDSHEARKALIRESYLATAQVPPTK